MALEVGFPTKKKITIIGYYRQFSTKGTIRNAKKESNYSGITNSPGYNFECDKLLLAKNTARTGAWISNNIKYNRLSSFDDNINAILALEVGFPTKKKITII